MQRSHPPEGSEGPQDSAVRTPRQALPREDPPESVYALKRVRLEEEKQNHSQSRRSETSVQKPRSLEAQRSAPYPPAFHAWRSSCGDSPVLQFPAGRTATVPDSAPYYGASPAPIITPSIHQHGRESAASGQSQFRRGNSPPCASIPPLPAPGAPIPGKVLARVMSGQRIWGSSLVRSSVGG